MYYFKTSQKNKQIILNDDQLILLTIIGQLGLVNKNQLDLLWSIIKKYPTKFSNHILQSWCQKNGLFIISSNYHNPVYSLTKNARKFLAQYHSLDINYQASGASHNSHNLQAVEVIVQGLYAACFKYKLFQPAPTLTYKESSILTTACDSTLSKKLLINRCKASGVNTGTSVSSNEADNISQRKELSHFFDWFRHNYAGVKGVKKTGVSNKRSAALGGTLADQQTQTSGKDFFGKFRKLIRKRAKDSKATTILEELPFATRIIDELLTDDTLPVSDIKDYYSNNPLVLLQYCYNNIDTNNSPVHSTANTKPNSINSTKRSNHTDTALLTNDNFVSKRLGLTFKTKFHQLGSSLLNLLLRPSRQHSVSFYWSNAERLLRLYALLHPTVGTNLPHLFSINTNNRSNTINRNIVLASLITPATITPTTPASITPNRHQQPYTYRDATDELDNLKNQTLIEHKINLNSFNLINKLTVGSSLATFCKINTINRRINLPLFDTPIGLSSELSSGLPIGFYSGFFIGFFIGLPIGFYTGFSSGLDKLRLFELFIILCLSPYAHRDARRLNYYDRQYKRTYLNLTTNSYTGLTNGFYIGFSRLPIGFYSGLTNGLSSGFYIGFFMELCSDLRNQTMNKTRLDLNLLEQLVEQFSQSKEEKENNLLKQLDKLAKGQLSNKKQLQFKRSKPKSSKRSSKNVKFVAAYRYPNPYHEIRLPKKLVKKIRQPDQGNLKDTQLLLELSLYNLFIKQHLAYHQSLTDQNMPNVNSNNRFKGAEAPLNRGLDLIANPAFNITDFDFRSFKIQHQYSFAQTNSEPFVADQMISFNRNGQRNELFLELDNRTESNAIQIQKILNYMWYALYHPKRKILIIIAFTDGSLRTKNKGKYTNVSRKMANLAQHFLRARILQNGSQDQYISFLDIYNSLPNLTISITGVSESYLDVAEFLNGTNYYPDYLANALHLANWLTENTSYNVTFQPTKEIGLLENYPQLLFNNECNYQSKIFNPKLRGIWQYLPEAVQQQPAIGRLIYRHRIGRQHFEQILLPGREHTLDSFLITYRQILAHNSDPQTYLAPITIYPSREKIFSALITPNYCPSSKAKRGQYLAAIQYAGRTFSPNFPYLYQPRYQNNLQLHQELRWLTVQFASAVHNYFLIGSISKGASSVMALRQNNDYVASLVPSLLPKKRSYKVLQHLAKQMDTASFCNQLSLTEIPQEVFRELTKRQPANIYACSSFLAWPFLSGTYQDKMMLALQQKHEENYWFEYDSLRPLNRTHPLFN